MIKILEEQKIRRLKVEYAFTQKGTKELMEFCNQNFGQGKYTMSNAVNFEGIATVWIDVFA